MRLKTAHAPQEYIATFLSFRARRRKVPIYKTEHKHGAKRIRIRNGLVNATTCCELDIKNQ